MPLPEQVWVATKWSLWELGSKQTESLFFTYGIVELREYLPGDVIIYGRVYRSSRETQKAQEWNI